jgi:pilus assembly protein CpaB
MRRGGVLILLIGLILIVGAVMLFLFFQGQIPGVAGQDGSATSALPTEVPEVDIVRARIDIPANTVISDTASLLEVVPIPQTAFDPENNFSSVADIQGQLTTRQILANQPIEQADLTDPGLSQQIPTAEAPRPRDKAYPFIVNNLSGVADQIKPGDFVDVVATFVMTRRQSYPTNLTPGDGTAQPGSPEAAGTITRENLDLTYNSTKTIIQRAQVLRVVRPVVAAPDATPEPGLEPTASSSLPQVDASGQPIDPAVGGDTTGSVTQGSWTLLLAVNDQEVELMEFALATGSRMVVVLRGAGDSTFEPTIGATFDLLVSEFGVPLPQSLPPNVIGVNQALTPEPTRTPAPTRVP